MREFKFRAWILKDVEFTWLQNTMEYNVEAWHDPLYEYKQGNIILMQYTGLKDKNDNDIYEGDIVKYKQRNLNAAFGFEKGNDYTEEKRVIRFYEQSFNVPQGFIKELEVIGNIYENPELASK